MKPTASDLGRYNYFASLSQEALEALAAKINTVSVG